MVEEIKNYQDALNPWSYDGINGNYGGPEKTWYTIESVPIKPDSPIDYKILESIIKLHMNNQKIQVDLLININLLVLIINHQKKLLLGL